LRWKTICVLRFEKVAEQLAPVWSQKSSNNPSF